MYLCLVGLGTEGAALSGESIHSNKSQSITTTGTANTGHRTHTALLLSTQVNTITPTHMHKVTMYVTLPSIEADLECMTNHVVIDQCLIHPAYYGVCKFQLENIYFFN